MTDLKKFSTTVLKATSSTDLRQTPALATTVNVHRRGATVATGGTCSGTGGTLNVEVYDVGRMLVNDTLKVGTSSNLSLTVTAITSSTEITVRNDNAASIIILDGSRLVVTSDPPVIYLDSTGTVVNPGTTGEFLVGASGFVEFYLREAVFDWIVSGGGLTTTLYTDEDSGSRARDSVNVLDYPDFQTAIDDLPEAGGEIIVPAGHYDRTTVPAVVPMTFTKRVHLRGATPAAVAGPNGFNGSFLSYRLNDPGNEDLTSDLITVIGGEADFSLIENIGFEGADSAGAGVGLRFADVKDLTVRNCFFQSFPSHAIETDDGADTVNCVFDHVTFSGSRSNGTAQLSRGTSGNFYHKFLFCNFQNTLGYGIDIGQSEFLIFYGCVFQSSATDAAGQEMVVLDTGNHGTIFKTTFRDCWFEQLNGAVTPTSYLIRMQGNIISTLIDGSIFSRTTTGTTSLKAILFEDYTGPPGPAVATGPQGTMISNNLGDLGPVNVANPARAGDFVSSSASSSTFFVNNILADNSGNSGFWLVTGLRSADIRLEAGNKGRNKAPSAADQASVDAIANPVRGDLILNNVNDALNFYSASGFWRQAATHVFTGAGKRPGEAGASPAGGKFNIGDTAWNDTDEIFGICTTAGVVGTGGAWRKIATTAW